MQIAHRRDETQRLGGADLRPRGAEVTDCSEDLHFVQRLRQRLQVLQ